MTKLSLSVNTLLVAAGVTLVFGYAMFNSIMSSSSEQASNESSQVHSAPTGKTPVVHSPSNSKILMHLGK